MRRDEEILQLVRSADPLGEQSPGDPPPFARVAARIKAPPPGRRHRALSWLRRSRLGVLVCGVALLGGGAAALAASGVLGTGATIKPIERQRPDYGNGVVLVHQSGLLSLRVRDPDGGPPWGMRYIRTSRGLGCLEVGRIVRGELGLLGIDDVYHNDGLFHPFANRSIDPQACVTLDGKGHGFFSEAGSDFYAAGDPLREYRCPIPGLPPHPRGQRCPAKDRRALIFGLTGPEGESITYRDEGHLRTERTAGPNGAYLIVLRSPGSMAYGGYITSGPYPIGSRSEPIIKVTYRNGTVCRNKPGAGKACLPVGYAAPAPAPRLPANIKTRLHIQVVGGRYPIHTPRYHGLYTFHTLRVTFRAPVAITNADSSYVLEARAVGCDSGTASQQSREDIHKGQTVTLQLEQLPTHAGPGLTGPRCGRYIRGRLGLAVPTGDAARNLTAATQASEPTKGETMNRFYIDTRHHR